MIRAFAIAATVGALTLVGCGDDDSSESTSGAAATEAATTETAKAATPATTGTTIKVDDSQFGPILFDSDDQAIYLFDKETGPKADCYGECAEAWPPVLTKGAPQSVAGLKGGLLGTIERDDGGTQITYNGHPLYYYAHEGPGEVTCHDVAEFGGLWLVVDPAGDPV